MAFEAFGEGRTRRPVRFVIYTRQSVASSDELSCAIQREACAVFAAAQGWSVVDEVFDDVGFSGATWDRPGLQSLLVFVRQAGADRILIHRLDRLSRNVRDCVSLFDEFRRLKLDLVIVTAPELGHAAQDHFLLNIMASFAEFAPADSGLDYVRGELSLYEFACPETLDAIAVALCAVSPNIPPVFRSVPASLFVSLTV